MIPRVVLARLPDEVGSIRLAAREFCERVVRPLVAEHEAAHQFPRDLVRQIGELGFLGAAFPSDAGGSGAGFLAHAVVCEELTREWSSLRALFNMNGMTCPMTILKWGTAEQRERLVAPLIRGELVGLFALTEPDVGSDVAGITTRADRAGGCYVLNGSKTWITHATVFDVGVVLARTGSVESRHRGLTALVIERSMRGITAVEIPKMGHHGSPTGTLTFEDVRVPVANRLGAEGDGFKIAMQALDRGRLSVAAGAVGVAQACLDESIRYARARRQFGQEIGQFQMVKDKIAQMAAAAETARLLVHRLAALFDAGEQPTYEATLAKFVAGEAAVLSASLAQEVHGAYGYSEEMPVARLYRDAKMYQSGEGTANVLKLVIANHQLGYKRAGRRQIDVE
jgi:glutaryl-CoA dehydrogenase (non-decarboxylating)